MKPGIRKRLIGYPLFFLTLHITGCLFLANVYLKPARRIPSTPQLLNDATVPTPYGGDPAWVTPGLSVEHPTAKVVFVMSHGYGGTRAAWRGIIEKIHEAGYEGIAPAMPGQDASPEPMVGFGLREAKTIVRTVQWVRGRYSAGTQPKIILLGVSMGGAASWLASEQIPDQVDAVITEGAYARFDTAMDQWFDSAVPGGSFLMRPVVFFARRIGGIDPSTIVPVNAAAKWKKPALVIQGDLDTLILNTNAVQLSTAAACPLWHVRGATHANCYLADEKGYMSHILAVAKQIGG